MLRWAIWSIVCFYTLAQTYLFFKDLMRGSFNIISPAYKYGRTTSECVILLCLYTSLIITFMNILSKIHLLWLAPASWLAGSIIGCCIIRNITNITDAVKGRSNIESGVE